VSSQADNLSAMSADMPALPLTILDSVFTVYGKFFRRIGNAYAQLDLFNLMNK
jgi:hypothetical protein